MTYMVEARTVWLLALLACVSILLAVASGILSIQAVRAKHRAESTVARADSIMTDWVKRGCIPQR